jgi:hypothetical protein
MLSSIRLAIREERMEYHTECVVAEETTSMECLI